MIIPVYNHPELFETCVSSIRKQTFDAYEVVIVDDGSGEETRCLCDKYGTEDNRFVVIHQTNQGVSAARNNGLKAAKGEYVFFIDSDDYLPDVNVLQRIADYIRSNPKDVILLDYLIVNQRNGKERIKSRNLDAEDLRLPKTAFLSRLYKRGVYVAAPWQTVFKRDVARRFNIEFPVTLSSAEDLYFSTMLLYYSQSYGYLPGVSYVYRKLRDGSLSNRSLMRNVDGILKLVDDYSALPDSGRYIGLVNMIAHWYGYLFYPISLCARQEQEEIKTAMLKRKHILAKSDQPNHKLILAALVVFGYRFVIRIIHHVYLLHYRK